MREIKKKSGPKQAKPVNPDPQLPLLAVDGSGKPFPDTNNAFALLRDKDLKFDSFANKIYLGEEVVTDDHIIDLQMWLQRVALPRVAKEVVIDAMRSVAKLNSFDPPKKYLDGLSWDGKPRLGTFWETYYGAEMPREYLEAVGPNWWISLVARILQPGCKVDTMPVLEGKQGKFKSSSLELIGGEWFAENTADIGTPNFYMALRGKLIVEIAELDAFARADVTTVKRVLSCATDNYRVPWGRFPEGFKRRTVLAGTTNKDDWARDETGERRFWPIACGKIDLDSLARDRDQLFAEATAAYKSGKSWWIVPEIASEIQGARHEEDVWEPSVLAWDRENPYLNDVTSAYILSEVIGKPLKDQGKYDQMRVSRILKKLGWEKDRSRATGKRERVWSRTQTLPPPLLKLDHNVFPAF